MIFGIGVDMAEIERIEGSLQQFGQRFKDRIFTAYEQQYCDGHQESAKHYAVRFAAKEAVSKALGTGIGKQVSWLDLEIQRKRSGEPTVVLRGGAKEMASQNNIREIKVSLTHAKTYALANAVALL